jgi:hypothetical protein
VRTSTAYSDNRWDSVPNRVFAPTPPDPYRCPNCGSEDFYVTSQCNFAHCVDCGESIIPEHEGCYADPCMIAEERNGDMEEAIRIAQRGCRFGEDHDPREHDDRRVQ